MGSGVYSAFTTQQCGDAVRVSERPCGGPGDRRDASGGVQGALHEPLGQARLGQRRDAAGRGLRLDIEPAVSVHRTLIADVGS